MAPGFLTLREVVVVVVGGFCCDMRYETLVVLKTVIFSNCGTPGNHEVTNDLSALSVTNCDGIAYRLCWTD